MRPQLTFIWISVYVPIHIHIPGQSIQPVTLVTSYLLSNIWHHLHPTITTLTHYHSHSLTPTLTQIKPLRNTNTHSTIYIIFTYIPQPTPTPYTYTHMRSVRNKTPVYRSTFNTALWNIHVSLPDLSFDSWSFQNISVLWTNRQDVFLQDLHTIH